MPPASLPSLCRVCMYILLLQVQREPVRVLSVLLASSHMDVRLTDDSELTVIVNGCLAPCCNPVTDL